MDGTTQRHALRTIGRTAILAVGIIIGLLLTRGEDTTATAPEADSAAAVTVETPAPPARPTLPAIEPELPIAEAVPEAPRIPVALRVTSFDRRDGTTRGSIMRICGVTDLPEDALIGYDVVPTNPGDAGWVTSWSPPNVREGFVRVSAGSPGAKERPFCFEVDVYGFAHCDMEPYHPLNCPVHVRVRFSVAPASLRATATQLESLVDAFGDSGERIGLHEDCTEGCPRLLLTSPPIVEYATRAFDSCPDSLYYRPNGPGCQR